MLNLFQILYLLEFIHNHLYILAVVHPEFDDAVEDAVVGRDGDFAHVDVQLPGDDVCQIVQHTHAVDAPNLNGGIEEQLVVHLPLRIKYAVAVA